jgi:hypothetical protein
MIHILHIQTNYLRTVRPATLVRPRYCPPLALYPRLLIPMLYISGGCLSLSPSRCRYLLQRLSPSPDLGRPGWHRVPPLHVSSSVRYDWPCSDHGLFCCDSGTPVHYSIILQHSPLDYGHSIYYGHLWAPWEEDKLVYVYITSVIATIVVLSFRHLWLRSHQICNCCLFELAAGPTYLF